MTLDLLFVLLGALAAGLMSGLAGFGTALAASAFWLYVLSPAVAVPLILAASVIAQVASVPAFKDQLDWRRTMPMVAAGVAGIPIGVWLLDHLPADTVRMAVGVVIVVYSGFGLLVRMKAPFPGKRPVADGAVGFVGGVLGGMIGLSGALPVIWSQFRGWSPAVARSIYQPFNTLILSIACGAQIVAGFFTEEVIWLVVYAAPVTLIGTFLGVKLFSRIGADTFRLVILWFLLFAGAGLLVQG
ncbi:MAG: sulfite exporter TauE/SafE family protein [Rhodospirillaceae bacterium]|nr:sulfite exporter TauE/SafE family protein [Rhodospirillaceae bacterium]